MRRVSRYVAGAGAIALAGSLWLPWFTRSVPATLAPIVPDRTVSGWAGLGQLGLVLVITAALAAVWASGRGPAAALVVAGGLSLMVEVAITADRLGGADQTLATTAPAAGILLALAGAAAIVLVGVVALLRDVSGRETAARAP